MENVHHMQKWHSACKRILPGYMRGYQDGRRSVKPPKTPPPKEWPKLPPMERPKLAASISSLTNSQRQQIAREVLGKAKAKLEREMAEKKARLDLIQREKAAADCHNRMLKAGFELPAFRFHPDVETIHAEQQERV